MPGFQIAMIPVTQFRQNCTLLWESDTRRAAVIDPGGEPIRILDAIAKLGLKVETILLTHGHLDHAGGAAALKYVLDTNRQTQGLDGAVPILGPDQRDQPLLERIEQQAEAFEITGMRNVAPDRWLQEGDSVSIGELSFDVLHCPGHTPGHIVFVSPALRFAIVGDVLFRGSVGRTDFPYASADALIHSIAEKLLPLGDDMSFVCGHGPGSTFGAERATNPFLRHLSTSRASA
jgi:glyoxylase-like metal-dependent hydrolase (beta-lactamase superfamily II)